MLTQTPNLNPNLPKFNQLFYTMVPSFYGYYTGQPALAGTCGEELEDFVAAIFYCPQALADGN